MILELCSSKFVFSVVFICWLAKNADLNIKTIYKENFCNRVTST